MTFKGFKREDITGRKFGRFTPISPAAKKGGRDAWLCSCECGEQVVVNYIHLLSGHSRSCGCLRLDNSKKSSTSHGLSVGKDGKKDHLYSVWIMMRQRCLNTNNKSYKSYGGRGIYICNEWSEYQNFHEWAMSNGYDKSMTVERINNNGPYSPDNCKMATHKEQAQNTRRSRRITIDGVAKTLSQWEATTGVDQNLIRVRIDRYGWSDRDAVTVVPIKGNRRPKENSLRVELN